MWQSTTIMCSCTKTEAVKDRSDTFEPTWVGQKLCKKKKKTGNTSNTAKKRRGETREGRMCRASASATKAGELWETAMKNKNKAPICLALPSLKLPHVKTRHFLKRQQYKPLLIHHPKQDPETMVRERTPSQKTKPSGGGGGML